MKTVTLTLELSIKDAAAVMAFLNTMPSDLSTGSTSAIEVKQDKVPAPAPKNVSKSSQVLTTQGPVVTRPTAGKITKMPSFMRSQTQIDAYEKSEAERVETLDEEAELKKQRKEERDTRKAEKDLAEKAKKAEELRKEEEVEAIKKADALPEATTMPKKPWEL